MGVAASLSLESVSVDIVIDVTDGSQPGRRHIHDFPDIHSYLDLILSSPDQSSRGPTQVSIADKSGRGKGFFGLVGFILGGILAALAILLFAYLKKIKELIKS